MNHSARRWLVGLTGLCVVALCQADDPHARHRQQIIPGYARSIQDYLIPDLRLVRDDGVTVAMAGQFATDRPVIVSCVAPQRLVGYAKTASQPYVYIS